MQRFHNTVYLIPLALLALAGCQTTPVQDGALLGGAVGAGLGAVIGHQSGHQGEGALIGAGAGALTGALIGDAVGEVPPRNVVAAPRATAAPRAVATTASGHFEMRTVRGANGEVYQERVWVPGP